MKRLTVRGHVSSFTGYGLLLQEFVANLERRGVFCSIRPADLAESYGAVVPLEIKNRVVQTAQPEEFELLFRSPWEQPTPGKKTIYYTMWESTKLPDEYVRCLNKAHHVLVPSEWNKVGFEASGVSVPISIVPLGISDEIFNYMPPRKDRKFVVGMAGKTSHGANRKGIKRGIELFLKAFANVKDVELQVKVFPECDVGMWNDPRVVINREFLKWHQVRAWFQHIDLFFSLTRCEGFGLWQLQSQACGRPVMAAPYAGMAQFLNKENGFCLPFTEVPNPDYQGGLWAHVSDEHAIQALLYAYSHRKEIEQKGVAAAKTALGFTWEKSSDKMYALLEQVGAI